MGKETEAMPFQETRKIVDVLSDMQIELKAPKSQFNSFGNYKYRKCEDILEALKPILKKHTACVVIKDTVVQIGDRFYIKATATLLFNGSEVSVDAFAREPNDRKGMDASQITGATSSYARKYALNGLFLIDDNQDPDTGVSHDVKAVERITQGQLGNIRDCLISLGDEKNETAFAKYLGVDSLENLPVTSFGKAMEAIKAKRAKKVAAQKEVA